MVVPTKILFEAALKVLKSTRPNFLIVSSIGNPEPQYTDTRHNVGHWVNNLLRHETYQKHNSIGDLLVARSEAFPNVIHVKSGCYMNISGEPIVKSWSFFARQLQGQYNMVYLVLHDELSKKNGSYQLRFGGNEVSPRGHNGLKSIAKWNKHNLDFFRLGIGISRPLTRDPSEVANYVLSRFTETEINNIAFDVLPKVEQIIEEIATGISK